MILSGGLRLTAIGLAAGLAAACYLPARRASRLDPVVILRRDWFF